MLIGIWGGSKRLTKSSRCRSVLQPNWRYRSTCLPCVPWSKPWNQCTFEDHVIASLKGLFYIVRIGLPVLVQFSYCVVARIGPSFLTHYTKETGAFDSCFPAFSCTHPETQASLPLAPAFILKYRHPQQRWDVAVMRSSITHWLIKNSFGDICAALCTEVLDEDDYAKFICVLESGRPIPTVLSLPAKAPYTALSVIKCQPEPAGDDQRASANPVDDLDMFALPKSFPLVYKVFGISDAVQQLLQEVTHRINYESLREVPNTPLLEFQWIDNYDMVVDQVVVDLVGWSSNSRILC